MTNPYPHPDPNPHPQAYGAPYASPPPPKKTGPGKIILFVVLGLIVLCGFGGCIAAVSNSGKSAAPATTANAPGGAAAVAPVEAETPKGSDHAPAGSAVRDGKFEFHVTQVETGLPVAGDNPFLQTKAQGQFVLVHVTVTNISGKPQSYFGSNQKLYDVQGRQFTNDTMAEINVNESGAITSDINPGNTLSVVVAFDIPVGAEASVIEFHDSAFSGGAKVALQ